MTERYPLLGLRYPHLTRLIRQVKLRAELPVGVITNGALLYLPDLRQELSAADAVMPTLDAGNVALYRKLNRPHPEATFQRLVDGLIAFRREYPGKLWIQVMLVKGLNDTEPALTEIAEALQAIQPDEVHLLLPIRPPAETWVEPADEAGLQRACTIIGSIARVFRPASGRFNLNGTTTLVEAIVNIVTRHPMREDELLEALNHWSPGEVAATLSLLEKSGSVQVVERMGTRFWSASPAYYPPKS